MPQITVKDNIKEFTKQLDDFQKRQIPFATSKALNDTAVKAQESLIKGIMIRFNSKKKWWIKGSRRTGIRVEFSNKHRLHKGASVYTNAYFAELQEDGGIKAPVSGRALAVPTSRVPKSIRRSDGIKRATAQKNVFVDKRGVFKRMAKGKLKPLFTWARVAQISPRFKFDTTATVATKRWFPIYFKKRLDQAIRTARIEKL